MERYKITSLPYEFWCTVVLLLSSWFGSPCLIIFLPITLGVLYKFCIPKVNSAKNFLLPHPSENHGNKDNIVSTSRPVAHRGCALDAPENTIAAFQQAKRDGATSVEFDLELTEDGVAVLLHDDTVDRTTDGSGAISRLQWSYVKSLNASKTHPEWPDKDVRVPTLEEAVQMCLELDLVMYFDCKNPNDKFIKIICDLFDKYPEMYKKTVVASFYPYFIYKLRCANKEIVTGLIHRRWYYSCEGNGTYRDETLYRRWKHVAMDIAVQWLHVACLWYVCGNSCILLDKKLCSRHTVNFYQSRDIKVIPWTINDPIEKQYFEEVLGIDTYMTDTLKK